MVDAVDLQPIVQTDEPFLWEMLYQAIYTPPGSPPPPREIVREPSLRLYVEGWGRPGDEGFVARLAGQPVGAAWLRLWPGDERGYGYVDARTPELSIAVAPGARGRGVGGALIERVLAAARGRYPAISLSVSADNRARGLYERCGFETVRDEGGSLVMLRRDG